MRILVYSEEFGTSTKTFIYNEVTALAKHAEVHVLCNVRDRNEPVRYPNVFLVPWGNNRILEKIEWILWQRDLHYSRWNPGFSKRLNEIVDQIKPDIIHCHFGVEAVSLTDNLKRNDIPILITFHGYDASQFRTKKSYHKKLQSVFARPNIFPLFVSGHIRNCVKQMGVNVDKGFLMYLGIDLSRFQRTTKPSRDQCVKFVQVSSFTPQKGHKTSVQAIRKFIDSRPSQNVNFVFGGIGSEDREEIISMVREYGLSEYVSFPGKLSPDQVRDLLEEAHVFIHHSVTGPRGETEGLPTSIMEAMAMELPILSSWHAGIPELVQDGVNGLLVNEGDVDTYVEKMREIMQWDYLPANRERVMNMCELNKHALELMSLYHKLLKH